MTRVSVLLIRENAEQLTGGGCCGTLDADDPMLGGRDPFHHARQDRRDLGLLHRAIRKLYPPDGDRGQVAVQIVDPRNQLYLIAKLAADVIRYRPGLGAGLYTICQMFSLPAVVVNGRVISRRGETLDPDAVCHAIGQALQDRRPAGDTP